MHTDNLLDLLPSEIISFILKYLPEQEIKNSRSIMIYGAIKHLLFTRTIRTDFIFLIDR